MKKTLVLLATLLALAIGATAQQQITFSDLPLVGSPTPMPSGYSSLNWSNFWYVDPGEYAGAGPGYNNLFTHRDVAFIGGQHCAPLGPACFGTITSLGSRTAFQVVSAVMAAGYRANQITVSAYNNGSFVGSFSFNLGTVPQAVSFPASWGAITEMQIQTDEAGDLVLLDLNAYTLGG
ncbi:MAG TPA: hypothetical protein VLW48_02985 [Candidatus Bathyarchaeia archaeon]|nr:hypothetical protein [Candidatus Bathyarchaeia archaeon]